MTINITVSQWREKHKRCEFCKVFEFREARTNGD